MNGTQTDFDTILDDAFVDDLGARPIGELRSMRDDCDAAECELSFTRRLLHGRIDILRDEVDRRADGKESTASELVARLPTILADDPPPEGVTRGNRLVRVIAPGEMQRVERDVEKLLGMPLGQIATASTGEITSALDRLRDAEASVSDRRRLLHERLDAVQGELARRYRDGEASVDNLLDSD